MATEPLALEAEVKALQKRMAENRDRDQVAGSEQIGLVNSLIKEFGLGGDPRLRRVLYDRLARLERLHGQKVELLIDEARSMARDPLVKRPGNYFARAICMKLRENGLV
jgi:hypothetical protein